jgi:hypothetical protein
MIPNDEYPERVVNRVVRVLCVVASGLVASVIVALVQSGDNLADLAVLATVIVVGELLELSPSDRAPLPLSFAVVVVLLRAATPTEFLVVATAAFLVAVWVRPTPAGLGRRALLLAERLAEAFAAGGSYHLVLDNVRGDDRAVVLGALAAAALSQVLVADLVTVVREHRVAGIRARGADLALVTSGMLMAVGYGGIGGDGRLGLWGPLLFSIPLLAAWYSFELLASTRRAFRQTVRALGVAPELGGLARTGHVERVAELCVDMAGDLELSGSEISHLETAALLHHLGAVCLDEPEPGTQHDPVEVARSGAAMLRASEALGPAGDIVSAESLLHRPREAEAEPRATAALAGQILKVASAFDELVEGDLEQTAGALEVLYTGPGYVYDGRVLGALERVLRRRGVLISDS